MSAILKKSETIRLSLLAACVAFSLLWPRPAIGQKSTEVKSLEAKVARLEAQVQRLESLKSELAEIKRQLAVASQPPSAIAPAAKVNGQVPLLSALEERIRE